MKMNKGMLSHFETLHNLKPVKGIFLELSQIEPIIFPKFIEWDGCVLLKYQENMNLPSKFVPNSWNPDRTAFEANHNHIHLSDYIDVEEKHSYELLRIGLKIMEVWECKLKREFPEKTFLLILSFDGEDCIIRFHTIRKDEELWIDIRNLEEFSEGILILKI